jgi:hypothetical protein
MPDCTQCGKPLADDAAFCSACGAPVVPTGAGTGAPSAAAPGVPSDAAQPAGAKPGANIVMITALAVIAIVAVIGIVFVATRHSGTAGTPPGGAQDLLQMQQTSAEGSAVEDGIRTIHEGIYKWSVDNGNRFPPEAEVRPDGAIGQYVANWPTNPYTGQPMASGSGPGDFTYTPPASTAQGTRSLATYRTAVSRYAERPPRCLRRRAPM